MSLFDQHYRTVQQLVDDMEREPDLIVRLEAIARLHDETSSLLRAARNKAAYEARLAYTSRSASRLLRRDRQTIDTWAHMHMRGKGLPHLTKERKPDLSGAMDLSREREPSQATAYE